MSLRTQSSRIKDRDFNRYIFDDANPKLDDKTLKKLEHFHSLGTAPLLDLGSLALLIGISTKLVFSIIGRPKRHYRVFTIKKRSGKKRKISAPRTYLKVIQWWILENILEASVLPEYVTGFIKGRSCIENAKFHLGSKHILNLDIKDFFPSVKFTAVKSVFREFGYSDEICEQLASLTTLNDELPQGAPTSPYLANLVVREVDKTILRRCKETSYKYSRYADDLTFSSDKKIPLGFVKEITAALKEYGFTINEEKTRFMASGTRMEVTGLVINRGINLPRTWRRNVRAMVHNAGTQPKNRPEVLARLNGYCATLMNLQRNAGSTGGTKLIEEIQDVVSRKIRGRR